MKKTKGYSVETHSPATTCFTCHLRLELGNISQGIMSPLEDRETKLAFPLNPTEEMQLCQHLDCTTGRHILEL